MALPQLAAADLQHIEAFRATHDALQQALIAPHFTLLFACSAVPLDTYLVHVRAVAAAAAPVHFHCPAAVPGDAATPDRAHVFLVPEAGRTGIEHLHAALYGGPMAPHRRADLPFVPHITIATLPFDGPVQLLCRRFDAGAPAGIAGTLHGLQVGRVHGGRFEVLARCPLGSATAAA